MKQNKKVHLYNKIYEDKLNYKRNLKPMFNVINSTINFDCKSFLDYGCGNGDLTDYFEGILKCKIYKYDPAISEFNKLDKNLKVDLIANCDVMEHIPEDEIDNILFQISNISKKVFFNIYLKEAETILPNGENAHCTIKPVSWWFLKINKYFDNTNIINTGYKNSVTFITWHIGIKEKIIIYTNIVRNFINYLLYIMIYNFKKNVRKSK